MDQLQKSRRVKQILKVVVVVAAAAAAAATVVIVIVIFIKTPGLTGVE